MAEPGVGLAETRQWATRRPVIAVTQSDGARPQMWRACAVGVRLAGGRPVRLTPSRADALPWARIDGLLLGGGADVCATRYGGHGRYNRPAHPDRDAMEQRLIEHAMARSLPIFGICRGAQMLNVFFGGTLVSDITHELGLQPRRTLRPRLVAAITPGSRLEETMAQATAPINALHHQAIDRLGDGLMITARDGEGVVQGIEWPGRGHILAVQWHPEFLLYKREHRRLFRGLIAAARDRLGLGLTV